MTKKKILLITEHLGSGGAERQICGLAALLTGKGYPCRLITYVENNFYEPYLREHNVDYEFVPELWNKKTRILLFVKYFHTYKPDVVISYLPMVNMATCLARIFYKCKLIVSERNNNTCITIRDRILFFLYHNASFIVPNSICQGKFIKNNFPSLARKIKPIINFVDLEKFTPSEVRVQNNTPRILTVARITFQKNCMRYLDAIKIIKERGEKVHFDWFGSKTYDRLYYEKVVEKIKVLEINDYIVFHDATNDIVKEYQQSDIFCLPSLFEGYPNVVIEAMCCGLPILCSNTFENTYIIKDDVNGYLFDPNSPEDIADKVIKMLRKTEIEKSIIHRNNRQQCERFNTSEKFIQSYINLIESEE